MSNQLRALAVPEGGYGEDEDVANAEDESYLEVALELMPSLHALRAKSHMRVNAWHHFLIHFFFSWWWQALEEMAEKEKVTSVRYVGGKKVNDDGDEDDDDEENENEDDDDYAYTSVLEEVDVTALLLGTVDRLAAAPTSPHIATALTGWEADVRQALATAACDGATLTELLTLAAQRHGPETAPAALYPTVSAAAGAAGGTVLRPL